jgi:archaemetzincin
VNIALATIGPLDDALISVAARFARDRFDAQVDPGPRIEVPAGAFDVRRKQFSSVAFMLALARAIPPRADRILGITGCDLFIPMLTFVFGQAQLNGKVVLVSTARLRPEFYGALPDADLLRLRMEKEIGHEMGHSFGLVHCTDRDCVMSMATSIQDVDRKTAAYCRACREMAPETDLEKEHENEMADPGRR